MSAAAASHIVGEPSERDRFLALDGLRGVAAAAVVYYHAADAFGLGWRGSGYLAVDFFFALSGFVIDHAYGARLGRSLDWRGFFVRRLIRLYPMILAGGVIGGIVFALDHPPRFNPGAVSTLSVCALVLLPCGIAFQVEPYVVDNPIWSLLFELIANAAYAIRGWTRFAIVAVLALSAALLLFAAHRFNTLLPVGFGFHGAFPLGLARVAFPFAIGVILHRSGLYHRLPSVPFMAIALVLTAVLLGRFGTVWLYDLAAALIVLPILLAFGAAARASRPTAAFCRYAGELSYPLYIVHLPIVMLIADLGLAHDSFGALLAAALSLALSALLLILYDRPVRSVLSRRLAAGPILKANS